MSRAFSCFELRLFILFLPIKRNIFKKTNWRIWNSQVLLFDSVSKDFAPNRWSDGAVRCVFTHLSKCLNYFRVIADKSQS